jgi:hypothetical protein
MTQFSKKDIFSRTADLTIQAKDFIALDDYTVIQDDVVVDGCPNDNFSIIQHDVTGIKYLKSYCHDIIQDDYTGDDHLIISHYDLYKI